MNSILYSALHRRAALQLHMPSTALAAVLTLLSKQPICKCKDIQVNKLCRLLSHRSFKSLARDEKPQHLSFKHCLPWLTERS